MENKKGGLKCPNCSHVFTPFKKICPSCKKPVAVNGKYPVVELIDWEKELLA